MAITPLINPRLSKRLPAPLARRPRPSSPDVSVPKPGADPAPRRIASNFAAMSAAEIVCRGTSVAVTLSLARNLGSAGYGRIEFAFNVVFWLVLLVRDGVEVIAVREVARHPRLIRPLVNHVLAVKLLLALALFAGLVTIASMTLGAGTDRTVLILYGLMLLTTAMGIDFVYRGTERMGLTAFSLCLRTVVYATGVWLWVSDATRIVWVPAWLVLGEALGIGLVWACYTRQYGLPRPILGMRFIRVFLHRGRSVVHIQVAQTIINSADLMVVGLLCAWSDVGCYGLPHRMIAAILTFGLIFQQVAFPMLSRSWRQTVCAGRETLNGLVEVVLMGLVPVAVGGSLLAGPLVRLLPEEYSGASILLAVGIWRAPLLTLAFLYQTTLIALNRESIGVRLLSTGAVASGPLVAVFCLLFGLPGASLAVVLIALGLVLAGYACLAREGRQPAWHHHLWRPLAASLVMAPVCLVLARWHVLAAVAGGALTYAIVIVAMGGLKRPGIRLILCRSRIA
ncbi:MAG: lipopolysaccharide biosynthesis protein [Isosphaeraceae bacterium]|nr:lipopolysaccharide biosynthesis protein [Isosphaeraceae bacterium]